MIELLLQQLGAFGDLIEVVNMVAYLQYSDITKLSICFLLPLNMSISN